MTSESVMVKRGVAMANNFVGYVALYGDVESALADFSALGKLREDDLVGKYDAAVIDQESGKPHIVKRVDRPRLEVIPELIGRGVLPRGELDDAAKELDPGEVALVAIGEPTLGKAFDKAVTGANKVAKDAFEVSADDLTDALMNAGLY
jgi:hypothetical protein